MLFWTIVKVGVKSLWANKLRSFLAMLGIIIGVASVIAMLAIGAGSRKEMMTMITSRGSNMLTISPEQVSQSGVTGGTRQNLTVADAQAMLGVEGVQRVAPVVSGNMQIKFRGKNQPTPVAGCTSTYLPIRSFEIESGRCFSDADEESRTRVAVLGPATVEKLFGVDDPLNQIIKIKGLNFRVIGVTKAKGDQGWFNPDNQAFIPYTTAMDQLFGTTYLREINIQATTAEELKPVQERLTALLRRRHKLLDGMEDDFRIRNQADFIAMANQMNQTFTLLLGSIASISLLVGGIGIMNIMLVTVTERTREIGIRKAIGATEKSIMHQFLAETLIISGAGGLIGSLAGIGLALVLPTFTPFKTDLQWTSVLMALIFSGGVGIFFGWYPARRAAQLVPVEALRYE